MRGRGVPLAGGGVPAHAAGRARARPGRRAARAGRRAPAGSPPLLFHVEVFAMFKCVASIFFAYAISYIQQCFYM